MYCRTSYAFLSMSRRLVARDKDFHQISRECELRSPLFSTDPSLRCRDSMRRFCAVCWDHCVPIFPALALVIELSRKSIVHAFCKAIRSVLCIQSLRFQYGPEYEPQLHERYAFDSHQGNVLGCLSLESAALGAYDRFVSKSMDILT